ncbi:ferredoxin, 2fe-2s-like protein [Novymonas esmeraldas]|uniref:Ferredoxin, 2fe-2s-like protein n=1 Tax=Novymonas esmeraldas TaxID=1808958 RepID=A0AAW0F5I0_9TRYP
MHARRGGLSLVASIVRGGGRRHITTVDPGVTCGDSTAAPSTACSSSSSAAEFPLVVPGKVHVRIRASDGATHERLFNDGDNMMEAIRDDGTLPVDVPGACNGTCKCSTCHVLLPSAEWMERVGRLCPVSDAEQDCLDKAPGVTDASRLSCQLTLAEELNGLEVQLPQTTIDVRWQAALRRSVKK